MFKSSFLKDNYFILSGWNDIMKKIVMEGCLVG